MSFPKHNPVKAPWQSIIYALAVWGFLFVMHRGHLLWQQGQCLFLDTDSFFLQTVCNLGGIGRYLGILLTQFFFWPLLGSGIVALLLALSLWALQRYCRIYALPFFVHPLMFVVPTLALAAMCCSDAFRIDLVVSVFVASMGLLPTFRKLSQRLVWSLLLAALLAAAFAWETAVLVFALLTLSLFKSGMKAPAWLNWGLTLVFGAGSIAAIFFIMGDLQRDRDCLYILSARNRDWNYLINASVEPSRDRTMTMCACVNLALANIHRQGEEHSLLASQAFVNPEFGKACLLPPEGYENNIVACEVCFNIGAVSEARRYAFEAMTSLTEDALAPFWLTRLAECALIDGKMELARKYLTILSHNFIYRYSALKLLEMSDEDVDGHFLYGRLRDWRLKENVPLQGSSAEYLFMSMYIANPDNVIAQDYLRACSQL